MNYYKEQLQKLVEFLKSDRIAEAKHQAQYLSAIDFYYIRLTVVYRNEDNELRELSIEHVFSAISFDKAVEFGVRYSLNHLADMGSVYKDGRIQSLRVGEYEIKHIEDGLKGEPTTKFVDHPLCLFYYRADRLPMGMSLTNFYEEWNKKTPLERKEINCHN